MSLVEQSENTPAVVAQRSESSAQPRHLIYRAFDDVHARLVLDDRWHAEPIIVLLVAAFSLALLNFLSNAPLLENFLSAPTESISAQWASSYWVGCRVLCYFLIPVITLVALGRNPLDFGLRSGGVAQHMRLYAAMFACFLPIVIAVSFTSAFQRYYPFYDYAGASLSGLLLWESLYALQFVTLEFFYRGFLLFSLERYIGVYAVFVMVIPYCMVHFGKPFAETLAAIPAGVILGVLALKTRSILPGAALHIAVAWTMDLLSLWHRGSLAQLFRP